MAEIRTPTGAELATGASGPASYANRFYVQAGPAGCRIAFAEEVQGNPPAFRSAVLLSFEDAANLAEVIRDVLAKGVRRGPLPTFKP